MNEINQLFLEALSASLRGERVQWENPLEAQDWAALYPLMADAQDDPLPTLSVFETEMSALGISLLTYSVSSGTVSFDGQTATLVLDAEIRSRDGGDAQIVRESVPLRRVQDNWAMDIGTLRSLMIRD